VLHTPDIIFSAYSGIFKEAYYQVP